MNLKRKNAIYFYVVLIVLLMILPINSPQSKINHIFILKLRADHWIHMLVFLPWQMFDTGSKLFQKRINWFLLGICFACAAEGIQYFLPYRGFNMNDAIANISGVITGGMLSLLFKKQHGAE